MGIFASKAAALAFAPSVLGFECRIGHHGAGCHWIGSDGDRPWPMPIGFGVRVVWCSCSCHDEAAGRSQLELPLG